MTLLTQCAIVTTPGLRAALIQQRTQPSGYNAFGEEDMRTYCLSLLTVSSLAAIVASEPAAASTQLCPGAALAGVSGPITNGSSCNLEATGTTVSEVFVGVSAKDTDILNLGSTFIFNNQTATTTPPIIPAMQSVTKGDSLPYNLTNTNDPLSFLIGGPPTFDAGTAYTNPAVSFPPLSTSRRCPGFITSPGSTSQTRPTSTRCLVPRSPYRPRSTPLS